MTYSSNYFNINGRQSGNRVFLTHYVLSPATNTRLLPSTIKILDQYIPTIFDNECFNGQNLPFRVEAANTEIGHLLEHLILENLKLLSEEKYGVGDFSGSTSWDWHKDCVGKFNIVIFAQSIERDMFATAFRTSVWILNKIFDCDASIERSEVNHIPRPIAPSESSQSSLMI